MGEDEIEEAQIDAYAEHIRDLSTMFGKVRGSPFAPPDEETEAKIAKFYEVRSNAVLFFPYVAALSFK